MAEKILVIVFLLLAMLGLAELLHLLKLYILFPKKKGERIFMIKLEGENALADLKAFYCEYTWFGTRLAKKLMALDCDAREIDACKSFCKDNNIIFISQEEKDRLYEYFNKATKKHLL